MNQQLITTTKATILVVDLPEGVTAPRIENFKNYSSLFSGESSICRLPPGEWQLLGKTFDLSEIEWSEIVSIGADYDKLGYFNYEANDLAVFKYPFDTATESGLSLLTANKVFKENPYGDKLMRYNTYESVHKVCGAPRFTYKEYKAKWQEAEQHVFKNAYTLIKRG